MTIICQRVEEAGVPGGDVLDVPQPVVDEAGEAALLTTAFCQCKRPAA